MKLSNSQKIISIILMCLIVMLLVLIVTTTKEVQETKKFEEIKLIEKPEVTVQVIFEDYNIKMINQVRNKYYVSFDRNLYNEDGTDNKVFFDNLIADLCSFLQDNFYLIDEEKGIDIKVFYKKDQKPTVIINERLDYYAEANGDTYFKIDNSKIIPETNISTNHTTLTTLEVTDHKYYELENKIGKPEGQDEDGYLLFDNEKIKVLNSIHGKRVLNTVYKEEYMNQLVSKVSEGYSLKSVIQAYGEPDFGGYSDGYAGYRNQDFYFFFYDDEVSLHYYSYTSETKFEKFLEEYRLDGDLEKFDKVVRANWRDYYDYELDLENNRLYLSYPCKGVVIDITEDNPQGITFYNNYYFSDKTRKMLKDGYFDFEPDKDLVHQTELKRRYK